MYSAAQPWHGWKKTLLVEGTRGNTMKGNELQSQASSTTSRGGVCQDFTVQKRQFPVRLLKKQRWLIQPEVTTATGTHVS